MAALWLALTLAVAAAASTGASPQAAGTCNVTLKKGYSVGGLAYRQLKGTGSTACCAACVADTKCAGFVVSAGRGRGGGECLLKADLHGIHAKSTNDCGAVRGTLPPPGPAPKPAPGPPAPPAGPPPTPPPAGSPKWELVSTEPLPVIGHKHPDVLSASILAGFETGQYQRIGDTFYYTANELGMCTGVVWDLVTRAALWSAKNSTGPWTRVATLRNGSHIETLCKKKKCAVPCKESCCSGTDDEPSFVTWAPTLIHAPSSVNATGKDVWNLFYSSNQNSHMGDSAFNGITWAVSTTESMLGPYVDVVGKNGSGLPPGGEGVVNVAVNNSHSFSAWKLRNGSWAGFSNNVPGAKSFSAALMVPAGDPTVPGGAWKGAGPNLASGSECSAGFCYAPENPLVTTMSTDKKFFLAVYDALEQPPIDEPPTVTVPTPVDDMPPPPPLATGAGKPGGNPICSSKTGCNRIGVAFSADGVTWKYSAMVPVQTASTHPCGQIRTPLGMAPEPERCKGCYSVMWTGISDQAGPSGNFRPVCHATIRNVNE